MTIEERTEKIIREASVKLEDALRHAVLCMRGRTWEAAYDDARDKANSKPPAPVEAVECGSRDHRYQTVEEMNRCVRCGKDGTPIFGYLPAKTKSSEVECEHVEIEETWHRGELVARKMNGLDEKVFTHCPDGICSKPTTKGGCCEKCATKVEVGTATFDACKTICPDNCHTPVSTQPPESKPVEIELLDTGGKHMGSEGMLGIGKQELHELALENRKKINELVKAVNALRTTHGKE